MIALLFASALVSQSPAIDPICTRWTFGAHEPYTMYRRVGAHCTGGIDGNAQWVQEWLDWFDANAPAKMEEIGLNFLHSRFYKGMGWEVEKKDFPNVQKFVKNCHAHGIKALAYVQFGTLYPEIMRREIPDIENWAAIDYLGRKNLYGGYNGQYFRWMPCLSCREWEEYIKRMCTIALTDGGFDGIMFDNVFDYPCYCERCLKEFRAYLAGFENPVERFGFDDLSGMLLPRLEMSRLHHADIKDPVLQAWALWRCGRMTDLLMRFRAHIKSVKPDAIVSGNPSPYRSRARFSARAQNMAELCKAFDFIIMQNENFPSLRADGSIANRVRDLKYAQDMNQRIVALCDTDTKIIPEREAKFLLPLVEDIVYGGIPTDRTIIAPSPEPGFLNSEVFERRKKQHARFNAFARSHRDALAAPTLHPVRIFYPEREVLFSEPTHQGVVAAEEIFLRNRVPYGYLVSYPDAPFTVPEGTEVIVVPGLVTLSDAQIDALVGWAKKGEKLVVTGDSGRYDDWNAQRRVNGFLPRLKGLANVVLRESSDRIDNAKLDWRYVVPPPDDGGKALMADLLATGWTPPVRFEGLPPHIFAEYRRMSSGDLAVHLVNYDPAHPVRGAQIILPPGQSATAEAPFEADASVRKLPADGILPAFAEYLLIIVRRGSAVDVCDFVDPFVGTSATGHTFPAACVPFGLVQAGPDTGNGHWDYCSGYRYGDKTICGFTQTHLNGTGCPDLGDIRILPMAGNGVEFSHKEHKERKDFASSAPSASLREMKTDPVNPARKLSEVAKPGYYAATLDGGIKVEIAAAEHSAIYRITGNGRMRLLVDCAYGIGGKDFAKTITASDVKLIGKSGLSGKNHRRQWVERDYSFVVKFGRECAAVKELPKQEGVVAPQYVFDFDDGKSPLLVKVALSAEGGVEATERNLAAEIPGWDFYAVKNAARAKWSEVLSSATIEGTDDQKKNWYTSLYHLFSQPNNIADVGAKPFYSTLSTWDTFRAAHPLYTILAPEKAAEFVDSMLEQGRRTGYLPIWTLWGKDNQCMIGTHSVPVIVDWFLKDLFSHKEHKERKGFADYASFAAKKQYWLAAYAQIKDTLTKPHNGRIKERWDLLDKYGYYPFDAIKGESVSRTMECAYDDWCAGMMAEKMGELGTGNGERDESLKADAKFFFKRSENWRNVFDASIGLVRGKDSRGKWREPFNPYQLGHGADTANDFTEGNAFQYTWHVMQNPQGLIDAMGGRDAFAKKLDSLFSQPEEVEGAGHVSDVTGLIGQYVHGNEPSHHVIYFYPQVGHPEKAAERIREVFDKFYLPKPDGLCGNDDCGQMSAWYLFSAMGFYPFNPCGGEYVLGAPQVACAKLKVESGEFRVVARNLSRENKYVESVTLNGKPLTDWKIRHADIMSGGELVFEMAARPPSAF